MVSVLIGGIISRAGRILLGVLGFIALVTLLAGLWRLVDAVAASRLGSPWVLLIQSTVVVGGLVVLVYVSVWLVSIVMQ